MPAGTLLDKFKITSGIGPVVERVKALVNLSMAPLVSSTCEPLLKVTTPPMVPDPPSVALVFTVTALALVSEPFTSSVPLLTVVAPV